MGNIEESYDFDYTLEKQGSFGVVRKGSRRLTGSPRAIKSFSKERTLGSQAHAEVAIMKSLDHINIVKLHEAYIEEDTYYLAMDFCWGGELFDRIVETGTFEESDATSVMRQILDPVAY